ncbi:unnamed protein product [Porites lobata]|uniref:DUF4371 domain-containing protein n=1 Tax=Porites lobata TaxID=104759 RepID=A0ABN8QS93_9CNID|nr:unnamed protein product [Porites lobata]
MSKITNFFTPRTSSGGGKRSNASSNSDNNNDNKKDEDEPPPKRSLKSTSSEAIGARCASSKKSSVSSEDVESIINDLFTEDQKKVLHHYHRCRKEIVLAFEQTKNKGCQARKTSSNTSGSSKQTYFVKRQGMYCLICKKYKCTNQQNKSDIFNEKPSVRYKTTAINKHAQSQKHSAAISCEMMNRVSVFQKELDERQKVNDDILYKVFYSIYWLAKEGIANRKAAGLFTLLEKLGVSDLKYFDHRSPASVREMFSTLGCALKEKVVKRAKTAGCFGLLVDDVSDISVMEQMITFIQFYDEDSSEVTVEFLSVDNLLEKNDSANATAMFETITSNLQACALSTKKLIGLATDGASVMVGRKNGLAAKLKEVNHRLVSVHCICHNLALACTDAKDDANLKFIKEVETVVTQLWKLFENSPKRLACYLKVQQQMKNLKLSNESRKMVTKKLKKACDTRWLSFNSAVQSLYTDLVAVVQTLKQLKQDPNQPAAYGLLKKINKVKFIGVVYILKWILPILATLSKSFQKGAINYASIKPSIDHSKDKLNEVKSREEAIKQLKQDLSSGGRLETLELVCTESNVKELQGLLQKYIKALVKNIDKRFKSSLPVLSAFSAFDPMLIPNRQNEFKTEWKKLKYDLLSWKEHIPKDTVEGKKGTPTEWSLKRVMAMKSTFGQFYPRSVHPSEAALAIPVSNAWPERGASQLKLIKSRIRSQIKNDLLASLLHITINGPVPHTEACDSLVSKAVDMWKTAKKRRKLPYHKPSTQREPNSETEAATPSTVVQDMGTQTDATSTTELQNIREEYKEALHVLCLDDMVEEELDSLEAFAKSLESDDSGDSGVDE